MSGEKVTKRYARARALVTSLLNKFHNGSSRAVDPFVRRELQTHEARLLGIQCFVEQGPTEDSRTGDESHVTGILGVWTVCGGFFGPGAVMRHWDACSGSESDGSSREAAMKAYVAVVDKMLPGWDDPAPDHPVASVDRFWEDDATATHCRHCLVVFSIRERRHHCRLCFMIFCAGCCSQVLEVALCPGAPLRPQRVCTPCFQAAYRAEKLREAKRISRENLELEQQIRAILTTAQQTLAAKQEEEKELRALAIDAGCDVQALDEIIQKQHGGSPIGSSSMAMELPVPPASHRFTPTQMSVEASNQLAHAHRQLIMSFKMAQVRAHRVLDKMDATIAALREAVNAERLANNVASPRDHARGDDWSVMIRLTDSFLTPADREALQAVSDGLTPRLRSRSSSLTQIALPTHAAPQNTGIALRWQAECLKDERTRAYVTDLAEVVRTRLDTSSGSDTEDSDANEAPVVAMRQLWEQHGSITEVTSAPTSAELEKAYELISMQCEASPASEWDEQIRLDVTRTFGISARRQHRTSFTRSSRSTCDSNGVTIPVERRRRALQNVLRVCASVDTEVGYCQGMDHVAALLLVVSEWQEARAFWLLVSLLASPRFELERLYGAGLPHLSLRCYQLDRLLQAHLRHLSEHFQDIDFPISIVATGWFMTLFTNMEALSFDVVVLVFEGFVTNGWKQLMQTALVILEELERPILASSFDEIPRLFYDIQEYAPRLMDPDYVLTKSAKYEISDLTLKRLQKEFEKEAPSPKKMARKPIASTDKKKSADLHSNQHSPKTSTSISLQHPDTQRVPQNLSPTKKNRTSKAPSSTRKASLLRMTPVAVQDSRSISAKYPEC